MVVNKIAVTGYPGSGVKTFCRTLQEKETWVEISIGAEVMLELETNGLIRPTDDRQDLYQKFNDLYFEKMRKDSKIWIKSLAKRIDNLSRNPNAGILVSHVKFPLELSYLRSRGFKLVDLRVDEATRKERLGIAYREISHPVDQGLQKLRMMQKNYWDLVIDTQMNYQELKQLFTRVPKGFTK